METIIIGMTTVLVGIVAVVIAAMMEHPELKIGRKFFSNFAPRQCVILDIFTGDDGQPYVKWQYVNDKSVTFTSDAKHFLLTHHVCW